MSTLLDPVASSLRRIARHAERVNRRIATMDIPGKVIAGSQDYDKRTLRLDIGRSADGRIVMGPPTAWQQPGAGTLKVHAPPKDGEQMRLRSPSGTVGSGSLADWSTYDDDNAPPSASGEEAVIEFDGKARITMRGDAIEIAIGGSKITLTESGIAQIAAENTVEGPLAITGASLTHNGSNVGSTHVHGGIVRGGAFTNPPE